MLSSPSHFIDLGVGPRLRSQTSAAGLPGLTMSTDNESEYLEFAVYVVEDCRTLGSRERNRHTIQMVLGV